jgi:D-alanyl-lipoteichoic acid acyltransferase DltB (MBOAT superfamily)
MFFHSLDYALFLAIVLAGYWALRPRLTARLALTIAASCLFYAAWNPWYLGLLLFSTLVDWAVARQIHRHQDDAVRKRWLSVSVVTNLTLLGVFKYYDFGAQAVLDALALMNVHVAHPDRWLLDVALPVGISFYTFESLSYCIDVYRRKCEPAESPLRLLFFITFFPKLVAGPIARPSELLPQLERPPAIDRQRAGEGLFLIGVGLVKKVVFADYVALNLVQRVFDQPEGYTATEVVVALYGFTLQMYCDFSGYTDIARGSGKLFGIELPENFDRPYQSQSPAEFWRRWHMTLSTWLRDYLYFPLGGSRGGPVRTYFNLWLTIFLIGLWHGASWTFVLYGAIQGTAVALHRFVSRARGLTDEQLASQPRWLIALKVLGTLQFVVFSRILFRATDMQNAGEIVSRLFSRTWSTANVAPTVWLVLVLGMALHYTPRAWLETLRARFVALPALAQGLVMVATLALLSLMATSEAVPYIYFQF